MRSYFCNNTQHNNEKICLPQIESNRMKFLPRRVCTYVHEVVKWPSWQKYKKHLVFVAFDYNVRPM